MRKVVQEDTNFTNFYTEASQGYEGAEEEGSIRNAPIDTAVKVGLGKGASTLEGLCLLADSFEPPPGNNPKRNIQW